MPARLLTADRIPGAAIALGAVLAASFSFTTWLVVHLTGDGFTGAETTLTGWGLIGGNSDYAGLSMNEVLSSSGSSGTYRPALFPTVLAGLALLAGLRLLFGRSKIAGAGAAACGVFIIGWGLYQGFSPSNIGGTLDAGEYATGIGPWLVLIAGLLITVAGASAVFRRVVPEPLRPRTRGIQHPR